MAKEYENGTGIDNLYNSDSLEETRVVPLGDFKAFEAQEKANEEAREAMNIAARKLPLRTKFTVRYT